MKPELGNIYKWQYGNHWSISQIIEIKDDWFIYKIIDSSNKKAIGNKDNMPLNWLEEDLKDGRAIMCNYIESPLYKVLNGSFK